MGLLAGIQKFLNDIGSLRKTSMHNLAELVIQDRKEVRELLKRLLPFLILKERQAKIMLAVIEIYDKATVKIRSSISEKEFAKILSLVREIRNLNSRTGGKIQL